jgi:ribonuclease R
VISIHRRGFGFVAPLPGSAVQEEIFVAKDDTHGAVHGDTVELKIRKSTRKRGYEGEVLHVVKRARKQFVGIIVGLHRKVARVYVPLLGRDAEISSKIEGHPVEIGSRVVLRVEAYGDSLQQMKTAITRVLGNVNDSRTDIPFALLESEIRHRFPPAATHEADAFSKSLNQQELGSRRDLRGLESITIDPASAKDFDDALHLQRRSDGSYSLTVHVADVTHYVRRGSGLDHEAQLRANSTYFPGRCVPMLPPVLSDDLCSLKPHVDRLAVSVQMEFDGQGGLISYRIDRSLIRSRHRFSYEEAKAVLDGRLQNPLRAMLQEMVRLCRLLKEQRRSRGAVELALPELSITVDRLGRPKGTQLVEYDITHQLVEEFMLKANELVAMRLAELGRGAVYRIHDEPDEESIRQFEQLARAFGFELAQNPTTWDLQKLFDRALQSPHGEYLAVAYIRSMKLATYSPDNIGHYGLSLAHYCHFTSPIRRYADLIVHRILLGDGYENDELTQITKTCSDRERLSSRAEETVMRMKKLRLLAQWHADDPSRQYAGVVTRVSSAGIAFEVLELMLEGFLHVSMLNWGEYYHFDEIEQTLRGELSGQLFHNGKRITVGVETSELIYMEVQWSLFSEQKPKKKKIKQRSILSKNR